MVIVCFSSANALTGTPHPEWIGKPLSSAALPSASSPTLYLFTQTDCAACSIQFLAISALRKDMSLVKLVIIAENETEALRTYLDQFNLSYTLNTDPEGKVIQALGLTTLPAMVLADGAGKIQGFYEGRLSGSETREVILALESGLPVPRLSIPGYVGSNAPKISVVDWSNQTQTLLIFHSSTCHYCADELPHLVAFANSHPQLHIVIVAPNDLLGVKQQFLAAGVLGNIDYVEDPALTDLYHVNGTPTQILVNSGGTITWRGEGFSVNGANPFKFGGIPLE